MRIHTFAMAAVAAASLSAYAFAAEFPAYVSAAVANPARPAADTARDPDRKPLAVLTFSGVKPGDKVGEFIPGGGYYTRLLSAVVGPSGHVYGLWPAGMMAASPPPAMIAANAAIAPNVSAIGYGAELGTPEKLDVVWTSENYHDFHNNFRGAPAGAPPPDMAAFNHAVFVALKPGGTYLIEDHAAAAGAGTSTTSTLHRIDPAAVKAEVEAAGFILVSQSDMLRNPADPHAAPIFDAAIKGHTDKLLFRFKKPG